MDNGFKDVHARIDETNVKVNNLQTELKATNVKMDNGFKQINNRTQNS
jgi:hypothetical protein